MAAREDQAQMVVAEDALVIGSSLREKQRGLRVPIVPGRLAPQAVDSAVASRGDDPAGGTRREPVSGPALHGDGERVLNRLFGEVDVAKDAHQDGDGATVLVAKDLLDVGSLNDDRRRRRGAGRPQRGRVGRPQGGSVGRPRSGRIGRRRCRRVGRRRRCRRVVGVEVGAGVLVGGCGVRVGVGGSGVSVGSSVGGVVGVGGTGVLVGGTLVGGTAVGGTSVGVGATVGTSAAVGLGSGVGSSVAVASGSGVSVGCGESAAATVGVADGLARIAVGVG